MTFSRERAREVLVRRKVHENKSGSDYTCYECGEPIYHSTEYFYETWRIEPRGRKYTSHLEYRRSHTSCPNKS